MPKCLIMKLSENVDDASLIGINEEKFAFKKRTDGVAVQKIILTNVSAVAYNARIIGNSYFTDSTGAENYGTVISVNSGTNTLYLKNENCDFVIGDKHKVGTLSVINNSDIPNEGLIANTEQFNYMGNLVSLYFLGKGLSGKLSDLAKHSSLATISISAPSNSNLVTGDTSELSGLSALTYVSLAYQNGITGDISDFADIPIEFLSIGGARISGDISDLKDKKTLRYVSAMYISDLQYTDPTPRASDAYVMALNEVNLKDDVDNYLIANADCVKHPSVNRIVIYGTRTSASDSAVAAIKAKGYTIVLNLEEL